MLKEFKEFIARGNVIDLAVAVVLGTAFGLVVNSFANDVLMQFVAAVFGQADFNQISFHLGDGEIFIGRFITALVNFLIVAIAMFLVIKAISSLQKLRRRQEAEAVAAVELTEIELLTEIRDALVRRDQR